MPPSGGSAAHSGAQISVAFRLQLGEAHHAALLGAHEAGQQILERDVLRPHGVAAGAHLDSRSGELLDAGREVRLGGRRMERLERRAVHDERDRHFVGAADAVEMILNVAHHELDLVEVAEMVDHFGTAWLGRLRARPLHGG
jgi:hypothetical protein